MTNRPKNTLAQASEDTLQEVLGERQKLVDRRAFEQAVIIEPLLSINHLAQWLGISVRTIDNLAAHNEAPPFVRIGRQRKWCPDDVRAWLQSRP